MSIPINQKFNRLTILDDAGRNKHGQRQVKCLCDCGKTFVTGLSRVSRGDTTSCGCKRTETLKIVSKNNKPPTNGDWRKGRRDTPLTRKYPEDHGHGKGSWANQIVNQIKWQAKKRKKEWRLDSLEAFELLILPCFYCGDVPNWPANRNGLDRVDNLKGYIPGNVVSCCFGCNMAKGEKTVAEFKEKIEVLYKKAGGW